MSKNYYELLYIIDPILEEDQFEEVVKKFNKVLNDNGANIDEADEWGIRKFEYPIQKKNNGYYVNVYFDGPSDVIDKLERELNIDDRIMRFMTLKYDAKMERHRELQKKGEVPSIFEQETEEEE